MHHKWQSNDVCFLRYGVWWTEFFVILNHFLHFYPPNNNPKNQNFEKLKKPTGDMITLHVRTINDNHDVWFLRYGVWQTELFVILEHFLPFYPPNNMKNQTFEKMKKPPGDIIILHMCTINDNHLMYGSWDMEHVTDKIFCHFGPFFALLPP